MYFHLHFNVHLYCNIFSFSYAIPLHSLFTLPLPQPFPSYRSTLSVCLACLPNPPFILLWLLHFIPSLSSLSPLFLSHSFHKEMGTSFPFPFSALIYPLFYSSNQSFAVIHMAVAFLIYLPTWWRQQLPVDHLYTFSSHYMALHSTRWQSQNLFLHECNRNCGVFSGCRLRHLVQVHQHFRDCLHHLHHHSCDIAYWVVSEPQQGRCSWS